MLLFEKWQKERAKVLSTLPNLPNRVLGKPVSTHPKDNYAAIKSLQRVYHIKCVVIINSQPNKHRINCEELQ